MSDAQRTPEGESSDTQDASGHHEQTAASEDPTREAAAGTPAAAGDPEATLILPPSAPAPSPVPASPVADARQTERAEPERVEPERAEPERVESERVESGDAARAGVYDIGQMAQDYARQRGGPGGGPSGGQSQRQGRSLLPPSPAHEPLAEAQPLSAPPAAHDDATTPGALNAPERGWRDWEASGWDTGWAIEQPPQPYLRDERGAPPSAPRRRIPTTPTAAERDAVSQAFQRAAAWPVVGRSATRLSEARVRLRRRPTSATLLALFLLIFILTCCAPVVPLLRLGYDAADAAQRVSRLQTLVAGGSSQLLNGSTLDQAQQEIQGIQRDLTEINGAMNIAGAPFAAFSPSIRNYRALVTIGVELTTAANEAIQVAQTMLTPLHGGALSSSGSGLTAGDIARARALLTDAQTQMQSAYTLYQRLDQSALPPQLQPGAKYGKLLAQIPAALGATQEMTQLLDIAPALLGIGHPADYLIIALDRTELRPGGGFQGNYGFLELADGKQSKTLPLALHDTTDLDTTYYTRLKADPAADEAPACYDGPQVPLVYWWWPYRNSSCTLGWGLRDADLSADFPTDARTEMQIVEDAGAAPTGGTLQGVVAFTPTLIANLLTITGPITVPVFNETVNAQNLESKIHEYQLGGLTPSGVNRKEFTHQLSVALVQKLSTLKGDDLHKLLGVAQKALTDKDLQMYFADPRAELVLQQLGLASQMRAGSGDGFFVVDTNDGGNKANAYVTEQQTDVVTLLPDGGAYHQLQIAVTYNKQGSVYDGTEHAKNYNDVQRVYMPGDASILGYAGYNPTTFTSRSCGYQVAAPITDCSSRATALIAPTTNSDTTGRTMALGALLVTCGPTQVPYDFNPTVADEVCNDSPQPHTQDVYITWYTPHAWTPDAQGHGAYSEVVERQAGNAANLTVYVKRGDGTSAPQPITVDYYHPELADAEFALLHANLKPAYSAALVSNTTVTARM